MSNDAVSRDNARRGYAAGTRPAETNIGTRFVVSWIDFFGSS